jgi:imidazolonepropionase-like amidohydrolase
MLEAHRDRHFVAPGIAILIAMLEHAAPWGITRDKAVAMGYEVELAAAVESLRKMHKRGIRVLPGGDYGFAFTPHGDNARDLEYFVKYLGMTPMEALLSATRHGGAIMMKGDELGQIKDGYLADLLLVDGDPLANLGILREPSRLLAVMKDGVFCKEPEIRSAQSRWGRSVA